MPDVPLGVASVAITIAFVGRVLVLGLPHGGLPSGLFFFFRMVLGFSALGLCLLLPIAWLLQKQRVPSGIALAVLLICGAILGWLLLAWVPKNSWIGALAGVATAAIWFAFNRREFRQQI